MLVISHTVGGLGYCEEANQEAKTSHVLITSHTLGGLGRGPIRSVRQEQSKL